MAAPTLSPPPMDTALTNRDGKATPPWARWLQLLRDTVAGGGLPFAFYSLAATQTFTNNAYTAVAWDTKVADTDSAMSGGTFTVPTGKGGLYQVSASVHMTLPVAACEAIVSIYVNGSEYYRGPRVSQPAASFMGLSVSVTASLNAGDAVTVRVYQNSGANRTAEATSSRVAFAGLRP